MSTPAIIRRFRKELRDREEIQPNGTVVLNNDSKRAANTKAASLLLNEALHDRITIEYAADGLVCGCREEAAVYRLQEYTRNQTSGPDILLAEIPVSDLNEYLAQQGIDMEVYVPASPEYDFVDTLAEDFEDIIYGL